MRLKRVSVEINRGKPGVEDVEKKLLSILGKCGVSLLPLDALLKGEDKPDAVFVLGGDGTVLSTINKVVEHEIPVLGINIGKLGFLTELLPDELESAIPRIISGNYEVQTRMMLECEFDNRKLHALNEITVDKGASPRGLYIAITVSGSPLGCYFADGLIVSTPTGSTAYSMSAGGAIVSPSLEAILITPICPYTLAIRPVVVGSDETVQVNLACSPREEPASLTVDGQIRIPLQNKSAFSVKKYDKKAVFISYHRRSFYEILRKKLGWGNPPNP
jgi:NAD+ kinase